MVQKLLLNFLVLSLAAVVLATSCVASNKLLEGDKNLLWVDNVSDLAIQPPESLYSWLHDVKHMTNTMSKKIGKVRLECLDENWGKAYQYEREALNLKPSDPAWVRTVMIYADEKPFMYARVVLPKETIEKFPIFENFGDRKLGQDFMYGRDDYSRTSFKYAVINPEVNSNMYSEIPGFKSKGYLWLRCSTFKVAGVNLFLTEFFL